MLVRGWGAGGGVSGDGNMTDYCGDYTFYLRYSNFNFLLLRYILYGKSEHICYWLSFIFPQGRYSLSGKTSYRQISWNLEAVRLDVIMILSLWNLTGISAALLPGCLSNFRAIGKVYTRNPRLRDFTRSCGKTSVPIVNKGPDFTMSISIISL